MEPRSLGTGRTVRPLATLCVCRLLGVLWRIYSQALSVGDLWLDLLPALSLIKDYASPILGFETCI